jgi:hypothetical protein
MGDHDPLESVIMIAWNAQSNQVYCSSTCKQGVYRERKAALGLAATRKERSS